MLYSKASKAMYSLIQKGRRLKLPTDILKLFDSCVAPILLYGCEVWGYENTDIIEKVHRVGWGIAPMGGAKHAPLILANLELCGCIWRSNDSLQHTKDLSTDEDVLI